MNTVEYGQQYPLIDKKDEKTMKAMKYRKKPVEIEAMQWDGTAAGATPIIDWVLTGEYAAHYAEAQPETRLKGKVVRPAAPAHIAINTLEGTMRAIEGDFIIRGVQGEFYPCKPDIFEQTYQTGDAL